VRAWRQCSIEVTVSLLTDDEIADFDLAQAAELCRAHGIEFLSFPIADRGVPSSRRAFLDLVRVLDRSLADGKSIAIHCRQGIGRSALVVACLLVLSGLDAETAFERVSVARGCPVPETAEQRRWVAEFARELPTPAPGGRAR
jgi:protein-tyrosine phosphatase